MSKVVAVSMLLSVVGTPTQASIDADLDHSAVISQMGTQDLKVKNPKSLKLQIMKAEDFTIIRGSNVRRTVNTNASTDQLHQVANIDIPESEDVLYHVVGNKSAGGTGGSGSGAGTNTWWAQYTNMGSVKIIAVPKYLYANATAAVPIKFQIVGAGEQVEIAEDVSVMFFLDGHKVFTQVCKYAAAHRKDASWDVVVNEVPMMDGTGAVDNNTTDTYVAWVPVGADTFRAAGCNITAETTKEAFFQIEVKIKGPSGAVVAKLSSPEDAGCRPAIFGSTKIKIIELYGPNTEFSILEDATRQQRCHRSPSDVWQHVDDEDRSDTDFHPATETWPHIYPNHGCRHCPGAGGLTGDLLVWLDDKTRTVDMAKDGDKKEAEIYLMMFSRQGRAAWQKLQRQSFDLTLGCYFGVSYAHAQVTATNAAGMDLRSDRCTQTDLINALTNGVPELYVGDLGVGAPPQGSMINWGQIGGAIYDTATAVVAVSQPWWGVAMFVVGSGVKVIADHTAAEPPNGPNDAGEVYAVGSWQVVKGDGTPSPAVEAFAPVSHDGTGGATKAIVGSKTLSKLNMPFEVGDTYIGAIRLGAVIMMRTPPFQGGPDWEKISAYAKYKLTSGTFADNNMIHVHTQPN